MQHAKACHLCAGVMHQHMLIGAIDEKVLANTTSTLLYGACPVAEAILMEPAN